MKSIPKYSWLVYQKSPKRINSIMKKLLYRRQSIMHIIIQLKKNNFPISDVFIKDQLNHFLLTQYRWGIYCACIRNINGIHPLISEEKYNQYSFEKFIEKEGIFYTKEFYKYCKLKDNK